MPPEATPITKLRLVRAFVFSCQGLKAAYQNEAAFRQECYLACVLLPLAFFLPLPALWQLWLAGAMFAVLVVELLNSGLEAVVDRISPEYHELSGRAKDCGSAAVLVALLHLGLAWLVALCAIWRVYPSAN